MPRPKQRTPHLRRHVLQVAIALLENAGVTEFTARRIAREAQTSTPAVYELFGDKAGLVREVFFEGFRLLRARFDMLGDDKDVRADLLATLAALRTFIRDNPVLAVVMFGQPFADFDPGPAESEAGRSTREFIVGRVRRCVEQGVLAGDPTDIAHVLLALVRGLAAQEEAGWLGSSKASRERRWKLGLEALLTGLSAP